MQRVFLEISREIGIIKRERTLKWKNPRFIHSTLFDDFSFRVGRGEKRVERGGDL